MRSERFEGTIHIAESPLNDNQLEQFTEELESDWNYSSFEIANKILDGYRQQIKYREEPVEIWKTIEVHLAIGPTGGSLRPGAFFAEKPVIEVNLKFDKYHVDSHHLVDPASSLWDDFWVDDMAYGGILAQDQEFYFCDFGDLKADESFDPPIFENRYGDPFCWNYALSPETCQKYLIELPEIVGWYRGDRRLILPMFELPDDEAPNARCFPRGSLGDYFEMHQYGLSPDDPQNIGARLAKAAKSYTESVATFDRRSAERLRNIHDKWLDLE